MQEVDTAPEERTPLVIEIAPADWATADEVRRHQFAVSEQGYEPGEVREYLGKLGDLVASLTGQLSQLRKQAAPEVTGLAARMSDMLREAAAHAARLRDEAEQEASRVSAQAQAEAETTLRNARDEADRLRSEAQLELEQIRSEVEGSANQAAADAQRTLATANELRDSVQRELDRFATRLDAISRGATVGATGNEGDGLETWSPVTPPRNESGFPESPPAPVVLEEPDNQR